VRIRPFHNITIQDEVQFYNSNFKTTRSMTVISKVTDLTSYYDTDNNNLNSEL